MIKKVKTAYEIFTEYGSPVLAIEALDQLGLYDLKTRVLSKYGFKPCTADTELEIVWLQPQEVIYTRNKQFGSIPLNESAMVGEINGPWDQLYDPLTEDREYKSVVDKFERGYEWTETPMFKTAKRRFKENKSYRRCSNISDIKNRFEEIESLYYSIKQKGLKTQLDLYEEYGESKLNHQYVMGGLLVPDELRIAIGRNGEIIRTAHGKHRIAIANILDCKNEIPAIVQFRHEDFNDELDFKKEKLDKNHPLVDPIPGIK